MTYSNAKPDDLQLCGPAELEQRARAMAERNPRAWTVDSAYCYLRFAIEPTFWDIRLESFASGLHYVGYFGGTARCCVAIPSYEARPAALTQANNLMNRWFVQVYPARLTMGHWFVTHIALPAEVN